MGITLRACMTLHPDGGLGEGITLRTSMTLSLALSVALSVALGVALSEA